MLNWEREVDVERIERAITEEGNAIKQISFVEVMALIVENYKLKTKVEELENTIESYEKVAEDFEEVIQDGILYLDEL